MTGPLSTLLCPSRTLALAAALTAAATLTAQATARTLFPPHHPLWLCIHQVEAKGNWHATNGRYRGGLQLHFGWGYGTSYDASADSQATQEWGAELAWRDSAYSRAFLVGQWLEWDRAYSCLAFA